MVVSTEDRQAALRIAYQEVCGSYHAIDDIRIRLLGLLPLVSGAGIVLLLKPDFLGLPPEFYPLIAFFGIMVSLGLLLFEVRGVQQCCALIALGSELEESLHIKEKAQFTRRPKNLIGIGKTSAARLIYPVVLAAWAFVALFQFSFRWAAVAALCLLIGGFIFSFVLSYYFELRYELRQTEYNGELSFTEFLKKWAHSLGAGG